MGMGICSSHTSELTSTGASELISSISSQRIPIVQSHVEVFEGQTEGLTTYFTAADFRNVRRIRFSTERATNSRYVTGLLFEYQDTCGARNTAVVGQWLRETDTLDLAEGDIIVHIRTWYSQDDSKNPGEFEDTIDNNGKLVGVQVSTARGLCKKALIDGSRETYFVDYYANRLQDLVSNHVLCLKNWAITSG